MDPLLWWILLIILILLISALSLYFCYNLIQDYCTNDKTTSSITSQKPQTNKKTRLNKYQFGRTDVEDLTNIEKDYSNLLQRVEFVNEVETPSSVPTTPRGNARRRPSLLPDIHESNISFESLYSVRDIMSGMGSEERRGSEISPRRTSLVTEGMRRNSLASLPRKYSLMPDSSNVNSTDTLDCLDPISIETKRAISGIEDEVKRVDYEINYFIGGNKNLKFYEINEKLIRFNIALSDIECGTEELRKRKREVQGFITECKEKLKNKV